MHTLAHTHWRDVNDSGMPLYTGEGAAAIPGRQAAAAN